jgi:hypothetical protein
MPEPLCTVCRKQTVFLWKKEVLGKFPASYFRCTACGFTATETPYWLDEAYSDAIADMDTGILERNLKQRAVVPWVIRLYFNRQGRYVDFGGGYGLFVRLMRDKGFDFFRTDRYAPNLFARKFEAREPDEGEPLFELLTAFEVMEHLPDPLTAVDEMLKWSDSLLFTTLLLPGGPGEKQPAPPDWWYWSFETGQHVSFYTEESLRELARRKGLFLHSNGKNLHLLTRRKGGFFIFRLMRLVFRIRAWFSGGPAPNRTDRELYRMEAAAKASS